MQSLMIEAYPAGAAGNLHREEFYLFFDSLANPQLAAGSALAIAVHAAPAII